MKRKISFLDKENKRFNLEVELTEGKFSASGDCGESAGQCLDSIKPLNKYQTELKAIWEKWHLNDMNAGTLKQEECLKGFKGDYDQQKEHLKKHNLLIDEHPETKKPYKYGTSWLKRELPEGFKANLLKILDQIVFLENQRKEKLKGLDWKEQDLIDNFKIIALAKHLNLSPKEALELIEEESECSFIAEGITYFVGDEEETNTEATEYLTDDTYIYESWVKEQLKQGQGSFIKNLDDWAEWVIESDGFGSILNGWDGSEDTEEVEGTEYYIIRR